MGDPEIEVCLLCGKPAERAKIVSWYKYDCEYCGSYAMVVHCHNMIKRFVNDEKDKLKLAEWVKDNPDPGGEYVELTWRKIKELLPNIFS